MPIPKTKPSAPAEPKVIYPEVRSIDYVGKEAITAEEMKKFLGWEDEDTYRQRMAKDKKKSALGFGEDYLLKDPAGKKIRCWRNTKNRPYSKSWSEKLAQILLHSGPLLPIDQREWQFNGEPFIWGKYGQCLSGQHRGVALILAVHEYRKNPEYWKLHGGWESDPVLECVFTVGIDESPRTTRTIDNVKPRSLSDVFYTSGLFDKLPRSEKERCSKMMEVAVNFLWKRTGVSDDEAHKYQTHGESVNFYDRHPKLLQCIEHITKLNSGDEGRNITGTNLSPGLATAMMYLMGASGSNYDDYYTGINARCEKAINWDNWQLACDFWTGLAVNKDQFGPVISTLNSLVDPENGAGGRATEKVGVIANAWNLFKDEQAFDEELLKLTYDKDDMTGELELLIDDDFPFFAGIDNGEPQDKKKKEVTQEEVEKAKAEIKEKNINDNLDVNRKPSQPTKPTAQPPKPTTAPSKPSQVNGSGRSMTSILQSIKQDHPGKIIIFPKKDGGFNAWGNDATYISNIIGRKLDEKLVGPDGLWKLIIAVDEEDKIKTRLLAAKAKLACCKLGANDSIVVEDVQPVSK